MRLTPDENQAVSALLQFSATSIPLPKQPKQHAEEAAAAIRSSGVEAALKDHPNIPWIAQTMRKHGFHDEAKLADEHHTQAQQAAAAAKAEQARKNIADQEAARAAAPKPALPPVPAYVGHFDAKARRAAITSFVSHPGVADVVRYHNVNAPGIDKREALKRAEAAYEAWHANQAKMQPPSGTQPSPFPDAPQAPGEPSARASRQKLSQNDKQQIAARMGLIGAPPVDPNWNRQGVEKVEAPQPAKKEEPKPSSPAVSREQLGSIRSPEDLVRAAHDRRGEGFGYAGYNPSRTPINLSDLQSRGHSLGDIALHYLSSHGGWGQSGGPTSPANVAAAQKAFQAYQSHLNDADERWVRDEFGDGKTPNTTGWTGQGYSDAWREKHGSTEENPDAVNQDAFNRMLNDEDGDAQGKRRPGDGNATTKSGRAGQGYSVADNNRRGLHYEAMDHRGSEVNGFYPHSNSEEELQRHLASTGYFLTKAYRPIGGYVSPGGEGFNEAIDQFEKHPEGQEALKNAGVYEEGISPAEMKRRGIAAYNAYHGQQPAAPTTSSRFRAMIDAARDGSLRQKLEGGLGKFFDKYDRVGYNMLKPIVGESGIAESSSSSPPETRRPVATKTDSQTAPVRSAPSQKEIAARIHAARNLPKVLSRIMSQHGGSVDDINRTLVKHGYAPLGAASSPTPTMESPKRTRAEQVEDWADAVRLGKLVPEKHAEAVLRALKEHGHTDAAIDLELRMLRADDRATHFSRQTYLPYEGMPDKERGPVSDQDKRILKYHMGMIAGIDRDPRQRTSGGGFADQDRADALNLAASQSPTDDHYRHMAQILSRHLSQVPEVHHRVINSIAAHPPEESYSQPHSGNIHQDVLNRVGSRPLRLFGANDTHIPAIKSLRDSGAKVNWYNNQWHVNHAGADRQQLLSGLQKLYQQGVQAFSREEAEAIGVLLDFSRKPAVGQKSFNWDEEAHPRESASHDNKRPGEFAPKKPTSMREADDRVSAASMRREFFEDLSDEKSQEQKRAKIQKWRQQYSGKEMIASGDISRHDWEKAIQNGVSPSRLSQMTDEAVASGAIDAGVGEHLKRKFSFGEPPETASSPRMPLSPGDHKSMKKLVANINDMTAKLDKANASYVIGSSRAKATSHVAKTGNHAKQRDQYKDSLRKMVRSAIQSGYDVPEEIKSALRASIDYDDNGKYAPLEFARRPAAGQKSFGWDEDSHPRETTAHDNKRPGEFASKKTHDEIDAKIADSSRLIASVGRKLGLKGPDLDDFVADSQLKALRFKDNFDPSKGSFSTWISTVATNVGRSSHDKQERKQKRAQTISLDATVDGENRIGDTIADRSANPAHDQDGMAIIQAEVNKLPKNHRSILESVINGEQLVDIASRLGVTKQAVSQQLKRISTQIRNGLGDIEFARKPAAGQKSFNWNEDAHPRESAAHDGKRPGEFAPKEQPQAGGVPEAVLPHLMRRADWHKQEKLKPDYDVARSNREYWASVTAALANGEEVHPEAREQYASIVGQMPTPKGKQEPLAENTEVADIADEESQPDANSQPGDPVHSESQAPNWDKLKEVEEENVDPEAPPPDEGEYGQIRDIGEKIGGARKDTARKLGKRSNKESSGDKQPSWMRNWAAGQVAEGPNKGKWTLFDMKTGRSPLSRMYFDDKESAMKMAPIAEVAKRHRAINVAKSGEPDNFAVIRDVSDRKRPVIKDGFATHEDAMRYMLEHAAEILSTPTRITDAIHPQLEAITRTGSPRRPNGRHATEKDYMALGFRGVEFGKWVNNAEGHHILDHAYDAMIDMADVLGVPPKALSLDGDLALGFGSRGKGNTGWGGSARAHYERDYGVINMTKIKGAGSLAHEWMHALDHWMGRNSGKAKNTKVINGRGDEVFQTGERSDDYVSHGFTRNKKEGFRSEIAEAFDAVMDAIKNREMKYKEDQSLHERRHKIRTEALAEQLEKFRKEMEKDYTKESYQYYKGKRGLPASPDVMKQVDDLIQKISSGDYGEQVRHGQSPDDTPVRSRNFQYGQPMPANVAKLSDLHKQLRGNRGYAVTAGQMRGMIADIKSAVMMHRTGHAALKDAQEQKEKTGKVRSEFFSQAERLDSGQNKDYWSTPHEMAARAFESYIYDKIKEKGGHNDYLAYEKHNNLPRYRMFNVKPYPEGEERSKINAAFDNLFSILSKHELDGQHRSAVTRPRRDVVDDGTWKGHLESTGQDPEFIRRIENMVSGREGVLHLHYVKGVPSKVSFYDSRSLSRTWPNQSTEEHAEKIKSQKKGGKTFAVKAQQQFSRQELYDAIKALLPGVEFARKPAAGQLGMFGDEEIEAAASPKSKSRTLKKKPASGQLSLWDEDEHPRESDAHDGKRPGEFAPKQHQDQVAKVAEMYPSLKDDSDGKDATEPAVTRDNYTAHLWGKMNDAWDAGKPLFVGTHTRAINFNPHDRHMMRLRNGVIEHQRRPGVDLWDAVVGQSLDMLAQQVGTTKQIDVPLTPEEEAAADAKSRQFVDDESAAEAKWKGFVDKHYGGDSGKALDEMDSTGIQDADEFIAHKDRGDEEPKPVNPFREESDRLMRKAGMLSEGTSHDKAMKSSFALGTGRPGNASSARTSRAAEKRIESTIRSAQKAIETRAKAKALANKADAFDRGEIDQHGNKTTLAREKDAAVQKSKVDAQQRIANYLKSTTRVGDMVSVGGNDPVSVVKIGKTGITDTLGGRWLWSDITPSENGKPISIGEFLSRVKKHETEINRSEQQFSASGQPQQETPSSVVAQQPSSVAQKRPRNKVPNIQHGGVHYTQTPEFKAWHAGSQVVNEDGSPKVVYHGARRPDRISQSGKFDPKRATSGPMAFFTDDPEVANGYATGKQDTSLDIPSSYHSHFKMKVPGFRSPIDIGHAWHFLPHEQRQRIAATAPRIGTDDETGENFELKPEGHTHGNGGYDHAIKEHRGNPLSALVDSWLESGSLFGQEHRFLDVLKMAGLHGAEHHDPYAEHPGVFPVHLSIKNPLHTTSIPDSVYASIAHAAKRKRGKAGSGTDPWDKNYVSGAEFLRRLEEDRKNGTTHAWTSIPDWVTQTLQSHGYDGIRDNGGKYNQREHAVWIPFHPHQVKSPFNRTFDPSNQKFNFSRDLDPAILAILGSQFSISRM